MQNIPIQSLEFEEIKKNFIEYLKDNPHYRDFNFDGSGINTLLNLMAYNTHMIGYYVHMLLDESYIDTARTRESMLSHSKITGYLPKGKRAATAEVTMTFRTNNTMETVLVPKGEVFTSNNAVNDRRYFTNINDILLDGFVDDYGIRVFNSPTIILYEGRLDNYRFIVNRQIKGQRFIIRSSDIDINTLNVEVYEKHSNNKIVYKKAGDLADLKKDSQVYFISTNEDGYYQIFFGNDVFGKSPPHGYVVDCSYVNCTGKEGNGARNFRYTPATSLHRNLQGIESSTVHTISHSYGGLEPEEIEGLRFSIPHHFRRQNRVVTRSDYQSILLSEFRNIKSLNVWGGETQRFRDYGKTYISIKPHFSDRLTQSSKQKIADMLKEKYTIVGTDIIFKDPEYINTDITVHAGYKRSLTNLNADDIRALLDKRVTEYDDEFLSKFNDFLSEVRLVNYLKNDLDFITSIFTTKSIRKTIRHIHRNTTMNELLMSNPINDGVFSSEFMYGGRRCYLKDNRNDPMDNGIAIIKNPLSKRIIETSKEMVRETHRLEFRVLNLSIYNSETNEKLLPESFGYVDYENGIIRYNLPSTARIVGFEDSANGILEFTARPIFPDIIAEENNLVRIQRKRYIVS